MEMAIIKEEHGQLATSTKRTDPWSVYLKICMVNGGGGDEGLPLRRVGRGTKVEKSKAFESGRK